MQPTSATSLRGSLPRIVIKTASGIPPILNNDDPPKDTIKPLDRPLNYKMTAGKMLPSGKESLANTADEIVTAWKSRDFLAAVTLLEKQLAAVVCGESIVMSGYPEHSNHQLLQYILGVCASYSGYFLKAKSAFESMSNGIDPSGGNLDNADNRCCTMAWRYMPLSL
jgi:hypothetical protein